MKRNDAERGSLLLRLFTILAVGMSCLGAASPLTRGDAAWERRGEGEHEGRPHAGVIATAVSEYERGLDARPDDLELRWKLLRALHFAGEFVVETPGEQREIFERGRQLAEDGLDWVSRRAASGERLETLAAEALESHLAAADLDAEPVARLYFWAAIHWGSWSRGAGLFDVVRSGAANRMHEYMQVTLSLEPDYEQGGAYRLLGSLHANLPQLPFVSEWVDRELAIPLLERAWTIAPDHPGSRLLLGVALLELAPERRAEGLARLREAAHQEPRPSTRIEDLAIRREARQRIAELIAQDGAEGEAP